MKVHVLLLVVCCFSLSVFGTGRLFVDEITGYSWEAVKATNVHTDLMVVDYFTVENAVTATGGSEPHYVQVHAPVTFDVDSIDVTSNTVDLTSYGQNVALYGQAVSLSAAGDFIVNSVDFSMVSSGDINGAVGGTFGTYGTVAAIESIGNITFAASTDIQLTSQDRILLNADVISFDSNNFQLQSKESNIFLSATVNTTFASLTGNVNFNAGSGLQFGSSHGAVTFNGDFLFADAENFVLSGRSYSEINTNTDLDFETQSIAGDIWFYTERIFFDALDLNVDTVLTFSSTTAFESGGNFQMSSFGFSATADDIVILSVDAIRETAGNDIFYNSLDSTSILAGGRFFYGGADVFVSSEDAQLSLLVNGIAFVNSVNNDVTMDSPIVLQYLANNVELYAANTFEIQSHYQILRADTVDFYSFTSLFFNAVNARFSGADALYASHELTQWQITGDIDYRSGTYTTIGATGDIEFLNSANVLQDANSIVYFAATNGFVQMQTSTIAAGEDLRYETGGEYYMSVSEAISFVSLDDLKIHSDDYHFLSANLAITAADDIVFRAKNSGGVDVTANTDLTFTANDEINLAAQGNVQITTQFAQSIVNDDLLGIYTRNLAVSFQNGVFNTDQLLFRAPEFFSFLPADVGTSTGDIRFFGGKVTVGTVDGLFQVDTVQMTDNAGSTTTLESGDLLHVTGDSYVHTFSFQDTTVETNFDKDLAWLADSTMNLQSTQGDLTIDSSNVIIEDGFTLTVNAPTQNYYADKRFAVEATSSTDFTSETFTVTGYGELLFGAENDLTITVDTGSAVDLTANRLLDILASFGGIDITVTQGAQILADDIKLFANLWNSNQQLLKVTSVDTEFYFDTIDINFNAITMDAVNVFLTAERVLDFTVTDAIDVSTSQVTFTGGDVFMQATDSISFSTTSGDITMGSVPATTANPDYDSFTINSAGAFSGTAEYFTMILTGREEFQHVALWLEAKGSTSFVTSAGDFRALADNGIYLTGTNAITSSSVNNHDFIAGNQIAVYAHGSNVNTIDIQAELSHEWRAEISGMLFRASSTAGFLAGDIDLVSNLDISLRSLEDSLTTSDISFLSTGPVGSITFTGDDQSIHAGRNEEYTSDILVNVNSPAAGCSLALYDVTQDILIRALGDQVANQGSAQVSFNGGTAAAGSSYLVSATNQIEMFASGAGKLTTTNQGQLHLDATGQLTLGSGANRLELRSLSGPVVFTSAQDYLVEAGGVNGAVLTQVSGDITLQATNGNYESYADGTINVATEGALGVTAGSDMWFNSTNPWGGIKLLGANLIAETTGGNANSDLSFIGQNVRFALSDSVTIDAPAINFGQNNVYSPQLVAHLTSWDVESTGDVDLTTSNDDFVHQTTQDLTVTALNGATLTSGGSASFYATDPDDSTLTLSAQTALSGTAALFVETEVNRATLRADTGLMFLKSSGSKTGNGFLTHTRNNINVNSIDLTQNIVTTAKYTSGSADFEVSGDLLSTSATATFDSDNALTFASVTKTDVQTTAANTRIELTTEGVNGDIEFGVASLTVASSDDFFIIADKVVQRGASNVFNARGTNTGKILMDASNLISWVSQTGDITATGTDDIFFQALGENSRLAMSSSDLSMTTTREITFDTQPAEDGSIYFTWGTTSSTAPSVNFQADDWVPDIDGDVTVTSPGAFQFYSGGAFETSVGGWSEVISRKNIIMTSTAPQNIGDLHYATDNAAIQINSGAVSQIAAGSFGLQGSITSNTDSLDVTVRGNGTSTTADRLTFSTNLADTSFSAPAGTLSMTASTGISLTGTGITNGNGYIEFIAGTDLQATTTHAGGDIHFDTIGCHFGAPHMNFLATGTDPEKGYIKIVNDLSRDFDPVYWYQTVGQTDIPTVHISSGAQTTLQSVSGNIRAEYARNLFIYGGDVSMIAGRAIEFAVRGEGRLITNTFGHIDRYAAGDDYQQHNSLYFKHLSSVQFRTNGIGHIVFKASAGDFLAASEVTLVRSDVEDIYIESTGSVSFLSTRQDLFFKGVSFESNWDIQVNANDGNLKFVANVWRFHTSSLNSLIEWNSVSGDINLQFNNVDFFVNDLTFATESGDINFTALDQIDVSAVSNINVDSNEDVYFTYSNSITLAANSNIYFQTFGLESNYHTPDDGIVRFSGRQPASNEQPVMNYNQYNPTVRMPNLVTFSTDSNNYGASNFNRHWSVAAGGWCPYDRLLGFGQDGQARISAQDASESLCVCLDNVWLCAHHIFEGYRAYNFQYDTYRGFPNYFLP